MRWLVSTVVLLPLLVGGGSSRPEPKLPDLKDCPFEADPSMVVGKLLACVQTELGHRFVHTRTWRDQDGDSAQVTLLYAPEGVRLIDEPETGSYTILWTPRQLMTAAIVVQVTDEPQTGVPKSDTGTILVQVILRQRSASSGGCGGRSR